MTAAVPEPDHRRRRAVPIPFGPITADTQLIGPPCVVTGWSVAETSGTAAASLRIMDGRDANGTPAALINLNPSESVRDSTGLHGLWFDTGVTIDVVTGSVSGVVWAVLP